MNNIDKLKNAISETESGLVIDVSVKPQSGSSGFYGFDKWRNRFEIKVKSPPSRGKANDEVISVIAEFFDLKRNDIEIISGSRSTQKKILLKGIERESFFSRVEGILE
jgi:uncharacterized protein (TIGR00251 family)